MLHVKNLDEGLEIFKALGSELRTCNKSWNYKWCTDQSH